MYQHDCNQSSSLVLLEIADLTSSTTEPSVLASHLESTVFLFFLCVVLRSAELTSPLPAASLSFQRIVLSFYSDVTSEIQRFLRSWVTLSFVLLLRSNHSSGL
jgi:hypothetical protein